jgi:hypothetical protein
MVSSGMLHHVVLVKTDVSEELSASFIRVTRIGELGTTLAITSNRRTLRLLVTASVVPSSPILVTLMMEALSSAETSVFLHSVRRLLVTVSIVPSSPILVTLMKEALSFSDTSVLTRATWRNIPEDTILHSHRRENLKSYKFCVHCDETTEESSMDQCQPSPLSCCFSLQCMPTFASHYAHFIH